MPSGTGATGKAERDAAGLNRFRPATASAGAGLRGGAMRPFDPIECRDDRVHLHVVDGDDPRSREVLACRAH